MFAGLFLQAVLATGPTITLAEAKAMSPTALAARLLPNRKPRPVVDAIINGRGLTPPTQSVNRVWLVEQMTPLNEGFCRSHVYEIALAPLDPTAKPSIQAAPTQPVKIEENDRLWIPPSEAATVISCAAAPAQASGFYFGDLGMEQAQDLVQQARTTFKAARRFRLSCQGDRGACGAQPRQTLANLDWSKLAVVKQVSPKGESYYVGDSKPVDAAWGPAYVQFTFPYGAGGGATWVITVRRGPDIEKVNMEAPLVVYH